MICGNCGNQVPDNQFTCHICGAYVGTPAQSQQPYGYPGNQYQQPNGYMQNQYQQPNGYMQNQYQQPNFRPNYMTNNVGGPELGMKWFKFIIWIQLWISALAALATSYMLFTGLHYNAEGRNYKDLVYSVFPGIKTSDTVFAVVFLAVAIFAVIVRFALAKFKTNAPGLYIGFLVANVIITVIYLITVYTIVGNDIEMANSRDFVQIGVSIVLIIINITYFKNRKHLFVN